MIRYGVIGTGWIVETMIAGAKQYPQELQLTAVYSRNLERGKQFARKMGATLVFTDLEDLAANDKVDMVYVASPNVCHVPQCRLLLEHGKHVLCEKPLAAAPEEVESLQALAQAKGLLFREAIMMLYQPQLATLRQAVAECGKISTAHFQFCQLSSKYEAYQRGEVPNIFNPAMQTGALMDLGVYCVYPALYLFGKPTRVTASAGFLTTGADAAGSALLHYPDKTVVLTYSKIGQGFSASEIVGDKGSVTVGHIGQLADMRCHAVGGNSRQLHGVDDKATLMGREIVAFARRIETPRSGEEWIDILAVEVCRLMQEIRQSAGIHFTEE